MHVRSYTRALPADRRIYRIDRWAIPVPGGLPLAASAWFVVMAILVAVIGQLPVANAAVGTVGWPAAILVAPGAGAVALTRRCDDGRTLPVLAAHRLAYALRTPCRPTLLDAPLARAARVAADTTLPGRVLVTGPGRVELPGHTLARVAKRAVLISATPSAVRGPSRVLLLAARETVEVRS